MSTLQHVIFPDEADPRRIALYLDAPERSEIVIETEETIEGRDEDSRIGAAGDTQGLPGLLDFVGGPRTLRVAAGAEVSLAAYFNAFPAGYWARWTKVARVRLVVPVSGSAEIRVMTSDAAGNSRELTRSVVTDAEFGFDVDLISYMSGGWIWFDVAAHTDTEITGARWDEVAMASSAAPGEREDAVSRGLVTIAMTTMNKPDWAVGTLARLGGDADLMELVDRIVVVDQGSDKVVDREEFPAVSELLGERLMMIDQPNLGGSGGFSRGMYEALQRPESDFVMLMDDDVLVEPESVARGVRVARRAVRPIVVGGHMLDINHRSVLHSMAEVVDDYNMLWGAAPGTFGRHDFARRSLRQVPWLHRRYEADFNGWWMTLIPLSVVRDLGLSTPMFLKWDDAEFGLRAKAAGVPTVSFPGFSLWHVSWLDKDDGIDWQAYFHQRNRLVTGLLHAERPYGGALLSDSIRVDVRHLLTMEYYAATLRHRAMQDVLAGPEGLRGLLAGRVGQVRAATADFPEAQRRSDEDVPQAPIVADGKPRDGWPRGLAMMAFAARYTLRALLKPVDREAQRTPQARLAPKYNTWWRIPRYDSVLVPTADRTAVFWYRRDRRQFARLLGRSLALHWRIRRDWKKLSARYRDQMPHEVAPQAWAETFGLDASGQDR